MSLTIKAQLVDQGIRKDEGMTLVRNLLLFVIIAMLLVLTNATSPVLAKSQPDDEDKAITNLPSLMLAGELPPVLPCSFYGTVKMNGNSPPAGTLVKVIINKVVITQVATSTYGGEAVYVVDIKGDSQGTPQNGGKEGDKIQFEVGNLLANETAVWHSGTNMNLNLSVGSTQRKFYLPSVLR